MIHTHICISSWERDGMIQWVQAQTLQPTCLDWNLLPSSCAAFGTILLSLGPSSSSFNFSLNNSTHLKMWFAEPNGIVQVKHRTIPGTRKVLDRG